MIENNLDCQKCEHRLICITQQQTICEQEWEERQREEMEYEWRMQEQEAEERRKFEEEEYYRLKEERYL